MATLKLKSQHFQRRRYVVDNEPNITEDNWFDQGKLLKKRIREDSSFQIVGSKTILEMDETGKWSLLFEVIGPPQSGFQTRDDNGPFEILSYSVQEGPFMTDFPMIKKKVAELRGLIPRKLTPRVQFVIDGAKLELHFFVQKDYIQS